jgi:hypothetical protein
MERRILCFAAALLASAPLIASAGEPSDAPAGGAPPAGSAAPATPPAGDAKPADATATAAGTDAKPADATGTAPATGEKKPENAEDKYGTFEDDEKKKGDADPEKRSDTNYYLGAHFRDFIAPGFMFSLFIDGGPSAVNVMSGGPEFVLQSGALEAIFSITVPYADFSMGDFVFKGKSEPDQAYEISSSSLKLITVSVDLLGRIALDKQGSVALLLGGGVGISGVLGDIRRNQAYPDDPNNVDPGDTAKWHKCAGPGDPKGTSTPDGNAYCGSDNDHYGDYTEKSWVDGGSKPIVFPYVALPHIAFEVLPIKELMLRLDTGFSVTGFFFGLGAGGRLPI